MKVKVKGLVFVGFAAAILSANAMAANEDKTVTSKAFTEATYQKLSNLATQGNETGNTLNTASDTTYPSEKKVAAALSAVGGTVSNSTIDIQLNGTSKGTFTVNQATNGEVNIDGVEVTANKVDSTTGLSSSSTDTQYPSAKAVYDAIDASQDATTYYADGTTITLDTTTNTFSATAGSITSGNTGLVNGGQVYTGLAAKEDVSNKVDSTTGLSSSSTDTQYPSAKAVYDAIDNATGGLTIPAQDPTKCTAAHPCALVNEAGTLHWYTMAQDGYAGGELGDAQ